tara:strand:- start:4289 stop:4528 length:240 start_codon:yes stop_codon:yes gene_type:complete
MSKIKDRAQKLKMLKANETFQELIILVKDAQIQVFLDKSASSQEIEKARGIIFGLDEIERVIQIGLDAELVYDRESLKK